MGIDVGVQKGLSNRTDVSLSNLCKYLIAIPSQYGRSSVAESRWNTSLLPRILLAVFADITFVA